MRTIFTIINKKYSEIKKAYQLNKYDRFTIAEHFRKKGAQVGEGCSIIPTTLGVEPYLVKIGNHVTIAAGVRFITHDGGAWIFRDEIPDLQVLGPIIIEDNCVVGEDAILMPNIRIGPNSIVGAGSVVINTIPPNSIAVGVPARVIGSIDRYKEKCIERWKIQRPDDVQIEAGASWWTTKHYAENLLKLRKHLQHVFAPVLYPTTPVETNAENR